MAAADDEQIDMSDTYDRLQALPEPDRAHVLKQFFKLMAKVTDNADLSRRLAMQLTARSDQLHKAQRLATSTLVSAGVLTIRSFLGNLAKQWMTTDKNGNQLPRLEVWAHELHNRPDLVASLRKDVPSWAPANMSEEEIVANMARELEAVMEDATNDVHTFDPVRGLVIHRGATNEPTVSALACLAKTMGIPFEIVEEPGADEE